MGLQQRLNELQKIVWKYNSEIADIKRAINLKTHKKLWENIQTKSIFKCTDRYYGTRYICIIEAESEENIKILVISEKSIEIEIWDFNDFTSSDVDIQKVKEIPKEIINSLNNANIIIRL